MKIRLLGLLCVMHLSALATWCAADTVTASANPGAAHRAFDRNWSSQWVAPPGTAWLEVDFDAPRSLSAVSLYAKRDQNDRIDSVRVEYWDGQGFVAVANRRGGPPSPPEPEDIGPWQNAISFDQVTTEKIRLVFESSRPIVVWEIWSGEYRTWLYHPPEFYQQARQEMEERLARRRAELDTDADPAYRTLVHTTPDEISLERTLWTLVFSRKTSAPIGAIMRGEEVSRGLALASLEVVDARGRRYFQSLATDGDLSAQNEELHVFLEGTFTPRAADGTPFPARFRVRYDEFKSTSFCTVHYSVDGGEAEAVELVVRNTLGDTPHPLTCLQYPYYFVEKKAGEGAKAGAEVVQPGLPPMPEANLKIHNGEQEEILSDEDRVLHEGKIYSALWTDGDVGFQVFPLAETWDQMRIAPDASGSRYMTIGVLGGRRYADLTFIRQASPVALEPGAQFSLAFSLLPYRPFQPRFCLNEWFVFDYMAHDRPQELRLDIVERWVRSMASAGVNLVGNVGGWPDVWFPQEDIRQPLARRKVEIAHKYGIDASFFWLLPGGGEQDIGTMGQEGILSPQEMAKLREEAGHRYDPNRAERCYYHVSMDSPAFRRAMLTSCYIQMRDIGVDGFYIDCGWLWALTPGHPANVEGNIRFFEDLRLLGETFERPKRIWLHEGFIVTPAESLVDSMNPGEPFASQTSPVLPRALWMISYNPLLVGTNTNPCNQRSFDLTSPDLYKQWLANGISYFYSDGNLVVNDPSQPASWDNLVWKEGTWARADNEAESPVFHRYTDPLCIFDVGTAALHSRCDPDLSRYVRSADPRVMVNVYSRPGEALVVATLAPGETGSTDLAVNLHTLEISQPGVIVYDIMEDRTKLVRPTGGRLTIADVELSREPRMFLLKGLEDPSLPLVVWTDVDLSLVDMQPDAEFNAAWVDLQAMKVHLRVHSPRPEGQTYRLKLYCGDWGRPRAQFPSQTAIMNWDEESRVADLRFFANPVSIDGPADQDYQLQFQWGY